MANFLDKTFNLAGLFRGLLGGAFYSLVIALTLTLLRLTASDYVFIVIFLPFPLLERLWEQNKTPSTTMEKF